MGTYDYLVVGAGFSGCTIAERLANDAGASVLVVDRRGHIGGNAHDHLDGHGVSIHTYGPHIFHTNSQKVFQYLSRFTDWRPYSHQVRAVVDGMTLPVPFNLNGLSLAFSRGDAAKYERLLLDEYGADAKVPVLRLRRSSVPELRILGDFVYEKLFYGYTVKQWGVPPEGLDPSVTARVPIKVNRDDRCFEDAFQSMPRDGYTALFSRMLASGNITVRLSTTYAKARELCSFGGVVYTGPLDELFDYCYGPLPYRSLHFEFEHLSAGQFQPVGTVNYPVSEEYTRITEFKHLTQQAIAGTSIVREYPRSHQPDASEPYYPVPRAENRMLHERYVAKLSSLPHPAWITGRLAEYQYLNMDQAVAGALHLYESALRPLHL